MSELQDLVDSLAARIGRSVAIDDQRFRLVVFSSHTQEIDEVRRASILHREAPESVRRRLAELGVQDALEPVRIDAMPDLGLQPRVCIPIRFDRFLLGYMWLIEDKIALGAEDLSACVEAAHDAAPLMYRERILVDHTRERERQCVVDLLAVASDTRRASARSALEQGIIAASSAYGVIVVETATPLESRAEQRVVTMLAALERVRRSLRPHGCVVGTLGSQGIMIAAIPRDRDGGEDLMRITHRLSADLRASSGESDRWRIARGPAVWDLAGVVLSYEAALDANRIAAAIPEIGEIAAWEDLGAWRFLCRIPDDDGVRATIHPGLAKLANLRDGGNLMQTLAIYLDRAGDAQAAADELFVHRTSLYARLRRIERVASVDLSSGEDRLALHISLRLQRLQTGRRPTYPRGEDE